MDHAQLSLQYRDSPISTEPDTFVVYRIIGNDLPPRHTPGQSRKNLIFILEHEPDLPDCEKRFVVNRIVNPEEERTILELLRQAGAHYIHIPFDHDGYRGMMWDIEGVPVEYAPWTDQFANLRQVEQGHALMRLYRHKNNYVMNNNGARNAALREGKTVAKWVLPWDGNCFITALAWSEIAAAVRAAPELPCFVVPMARIPDNALLLDTDFRPDPSEEPQILFRRDSAIDFDTEYCYGRRPKVEMLWRLGVSGDWDNWALEPWDLPCPDFAKDAGGYGYAGWVARLSSGQVHLEVSAAIPYSDNGSNAAFIDRGIARVEAVRQLLDELDDQISKTSLHRDRTAFVTTSVSSHAELTGAGIMGPLREAANEASSRGPYSVVDKRTLPPSRDRHDYWHPAPYYWPHPLRLPGLPYVRRDGRRVPGTVLYEALSENYDRTRLQRLFDDTFILALAWHLLGDERYAKHAAALVRTWFLKPDTAMNPHLEYAQVRWGHNGNKGTGTGIIEMKDLYYFLDAVRLLQGTGWLSKSDKTGLEEWLGQYLQWLRTSAQGRKERAATNNHGTYHDLQIAALAAFLGEVRLLRETLRDSRSRMLQQFDSAGVQLREMGRTNTAHYCCFNLQGWIHLAQLAETCGEDLWSFEGRDGRGIQRAIEWLLLHVDKDWPFPQIETFDNSRLYPIYHVYVERYGDLPGASPGLFPSASEIKPVFFPHDGIMPFWQLALASGQRTVSHRDF